MAFWREKWSESVLGTHARQSFAFIFLRIIYNLEQANLYFAAPIGLLDSIDLIQI